MREPLTENRIPYVLDCYMKKKVVVAMSGGVDSSCAAAILLAQGYDVIGMTLKLWSAKDCGKTKDKSCCSLNDAEDARKVAGKLGIPFYVMDCHKEFSEKVIDYFCDEYLNARTPNPCIVCNNEIKFGFLFDKARALGGDYVATGHYAKVEYDKSNNRFLLKRSVDKNKDQSYVLFGLTQDKLSRILFPMGEYTKDRVRQTAKWFELSVADKKESQEICFVDQDKYGEFLKERLGDKIKPGKIVNKDGKVLGSHKGVCFYTIGQRKGMGIADKHPLYVVEIDKKENKIIVGTAQDLKKKKFKVKDLNWIAGEEPKSPFSAETKIRYNHPAAPAEIELLKNNEAQVEFDQAQQAVTPGQAAVFYKNDTVLGGGWIE